MLSLSGLKNIKRFVCKWRNNLKIFGSLKGKIVLKKITGLYFSLNFDLFWIVLYINEIKFFVFMAFNIFISNEFLYKKKPILKYYYKNRTIIVCYFKYFIQFCFRVNWLN